MKKNHILTIMLMALSLNAVADNYRIYTNDNTQNKVNVGNEKNKMTLLIDKNSYGGHSDNSFTTATKTISIMSEDNHLDVTFKGVGYHNNAVVGENSLTGWVSGESGYRGEGASNFGSYSIKLSDATTQKLNSIDDLANSINNINNTLTTLNNRPDLVETDGTTVTVAKDDTATLINIQGKNAENNSIDRLIRGLLAATQDNDAVNLAQLKASNNAISSMIGGNAAYDPVTGETTMPTYVVQGNTFNTVSDAIGGLNNGLNTLNEHLQNGSIGLVQQNPDTKEITVGADKGGNSINIAGTDGNRVLTGIAQGVNPNDAVTKQQLDTAIIEAKQGLKDMSNQIDENRRIAASGVASAIAMSFDMPAQHPGEIAAGVGFGHYDKETSVALGANYLAKNGKVKVYGAIGTGFNTVKPAGKLGIGFVF